MLDKLLVMNVIRQININMRCIEMPNVLQRQWVTIEININMRCIEMGESIAPIGKLIRLTLT